jgi:tetratricopeptide (TPR) repeat protein
VPDNSRIEDLRRRVQKDPASIAFAQLAEECRRAEQYQEAVDTCRAGLALHPGYLSARVTLGRALIELNQLDEALAELELVLVSAPENLAAIRGLAEIHHRRGSLSEALKQYRAALALARNDPDLERTVTELARAIEPKPPAPVSDGLSFEQMASEFMKHSPPPQPPPPQVVEPPPPQVVEPPPPQAAEPPPPEAAEPPPPQAAEPSSLQPPDPPPPQAVDPPSLQPPDPPPAHLLSVAPEQDATLPPDDATPTPEDATRTHAQATVAALDQWLDALHVARAQRRD